MAKSHIIYSLLVFAMAEFASCGPKHSPDTSTAVESLDSSKNKDERLQIGRGKRPSNLYPYDFTSINKYDSLGRKQGFWVEQGDKFSLELSYLDSKMNGLYKCFTYPADSCGGAILNSMGWMNMGDPVGEWHYFNRKNGEYLLVEQKLQLAQNEKLKYRDGNYYKIESKSYLKVYRDNGTLECEGIAIPDLSVENNYQLYGPWKFYDAHGNFKEEVILEVPTYEDEISFKSDSNK